MNLDIVLFTILTAFNANLIGEGDELYAVTSLGRNHFNGSYQLSTNTKEYFFYLLVGLEKKRLHILKHRN